MLYGNHHLGKLFGNRAVWKEADGTWRLLQELMAGGLLAARSMGYLRGASSKWEFHADVQNPHTCHIVSGTQAASQMGFCCKDS